MALNFSHQQTYSSRLSEDSLFSPIGVNNRFHFEDIPEENKDGFGMPWYLTRSREEWFECGSEQIDRASSQETVSNDIIDLLPPDPFGMDIGTTFTAITGWLEGLEVDYGGYENNGDYQLFAGLNFIWNHAMWFQAFHGYRESEENSTTSCEFGGPSNEKEGENISCEIGFSSACDMNDILSMGSESIGHEVEQCYVDCGGMYHDEDGDNGAPHEALMFALGFLGLQDLLSVERVCRSLRETVKNDPLLWRSIHIDQPLNEKITDDVLVQLTDRAQGNLQCLSLVECARITDNCLKHILENNLRLTKLSVPGCTRLSIEGTVNSLKAFKFLGRPGMKKLRIGGLYGVMQKHYDELKLLLQTDSNKQNSSHEPHFYHKGNFYLSCDDERAIDIEMCPICQNLRLVYDCPVESCQVKENASQACRACTLCIARCIQCGRCIIDSEYEETFCMESLCLDCSKQ